MLKTSETLIIQLRTPEVNIFCSLYLADNIPVTLFIQPKLVLWAGARMPRNALTHELFLLIMLHHVTTSV